MANDNPKVSTASNQTAQLQGSLVALDRNALMKGDQAIAREKLKLGQRQLEAQIEATKLQAQTTIQREEMVQQGWDRQREHLAAEGEKEREFRAEQQTVGFEQRQQLEAQAAARAWDAWKKQQKVLAEQERAQQITAKEAEARRLEADRELTRNNLARARIQAEMQGHSEDAMRVLKRLRQGMVEQAERAQTVGVIMGDFAEQLRARLEAAFEADADLTFRTSPAQGNIMPVQRVTASGNVRGDLADFATEAGAIGVDGRIAFSSLDEAEQVLSAWATQSSEGTINPVRFTGENARRQDAARDARGEEAGNWLTAQGPVTMIGQWVRGRSTQGQALDPKEVLHVQAAKAALDLRDSLTSLGEDLGVPDMADRFHQALVTVGEASLEGNVDEAEALVAEIIPPGTEPLFREFVAVNFDAMRGGLRALRDRDISTPGLDAAEKDTVRKEILDALGRYKDVLGDVSRSLPGMGISSVKEQMEPVKALLEEAIESQDIRALESLDPDTMEMLAEVDPEIKELLDDYTESVLGIDSSRDALDEFDIGNAELETDLAAQQLEGDIDALEGLAAREQEIFR